MVSHGVSLDFLFSLLFQWITKCETNPAECIHPYSIVSWYGRIPGAMIHSRKIKDAHYILRKMSQAKEWRYREGGSLKGGSVTETVLRLFYVLNRLLYHWR